jgi:transcriptional antiterminator RfaH
MASQSAASGSAIHLPEFSYRFDQQTSCIRTERWFVLKTRSREERILAAQLISCGVNCFLPVVKCTRQYAGHALIVEVPLFPRHVFVRVDPDRAPTLNLRERGVQIVPVDDQQTFDRELRSLHAVLEAGRLLTLCSLNGNEIPVQVCTGPLAGTRAFIANHSERDRLILHVQTVGLAVELPLNEWQIERIQESQHIH